MTADPEPFLKVRTLLILLLVVMALAALYIAGFDLALSFFIGEIV